MSAVAIRSWMTSNGSGFVSRYARESGNLLIVCAAETSKLIRPWAKRHASFANTRPSVATILIASAGNEPRKRFFFAAWRLCVRLLAWTQGRKVRRNLEEIGRAHV